MVIVKVELEHPAKATDLSDLKAAIKKNFAMSNRRRFSARRSPWKSITISVTWDSCWTGCGKDRKPRKSSGLR